MQITVPGEFQPVGTVFNIGISAGIESTIYPGNWIEGSNNMDLNLLSSQHSKRVLKTTKLFFLLRFLTFCIEMSNEFLKLYIFYLFCWKKRI